MIGLEAWQTSKLQNRRPLFDVELYLTVHKSFVLISESFVSYVIRAQNYWIYFCDIMI
jgi:hypothetical protein